MANIKQPRCRIPVRPDFPVVQNMSTPAAMFETFEFECFKHAGEIPAHVIVAWPHKHPDKLDQTSPDTSFVWDFINKAREKYPQTVFLPAEGWFEQRALARALDTADTRYVKRQKWRLSKKFQTYTLPPLNGAHVVILDDAAETGATMADFISVLQFNGAHVLMGAVPSVTRPVSLHFAQESPDERAGRLEALDADFRRSAKAAGYDAAPGECSLLIEQALNKKGYSLATLTPGEYQEMRDEFDPAYQPIDFFEFLKKLGGKIPGRLTPPAPSGSKPG